MKMLYFDRKLIQRTLVDETLPTYKLGEKNFNVFIMTTFKLHFAN